MTMIVLRVIVIVLRVIVIVLRVIVIVLRVIVIVLRVIVILPPHFSFLLSKSKICALPTLKAVTHFDFEIEIESMACTWIRCTKMFYYCVYPHNSFMAVHSCEQERALGFVIVTMTSLAVTSVRAVCKKTYLYFHASSFHPRQFVKSKFHRIN